MLDVEPPGSASRHVISELKQLKTNKPTISKCCWNCLLKKTGKNPGVFFVTSIIKLIVTRKLAHAEVLGFFVVLEGWKWMDFKV